MRWKVGLRARSYEVTYTWVWTLVKTWANAQREINTGRILHLKITAKTSNAGNGTIIKGISVIRNAWMTKSKLMRKSGFYWKFDG